MTRLQIGIALAVLIGVSLSTALFMMFRASPEVTTDTWSASGGFMPWRDSAPLDAPTPPPRTDSPVETLGTVPLPLPTTPDVSAGFDDLTALLQELVRPAGPTRVDSDPATPSSYAYIPQGLLTLPNSRPVTPDQRALHEYGNALGLALRSFADLHPDMTQTLKDQAEDRSNSAKAAAVRRLAGDFSQLGEDIAAMDSVPTAASEAHLALANAYRNVGKYLAEIPDASSDKAMLDAIYAYNPVSEELSKRLVAMIDLFQSNTITFSATDAGSIFTFDAEASY